jgi:preprotein translocase subunit SecG
MYTILLVAHLIVVVFLIGLILIQRSDSDGLSGLGGGGGNLLSGRAAGNVLTRTTAILATLFIVNSLVLAVMSSHRGGQSLVDSVVQEERAPAPAKAGEKPAEPSVPKPE